MNLSSKCTFFITYVTTRIFISLYKCIYVFIEQLHVSFCNINLSFSNILLLVFINFV